MTGNSLAFSECLAAQVEAMQFHKASFAGAQHVAGWKGSGQLIGRATVLRNGRLYEPEPSANPVFRAVIAIDEEDVRHAFVKDLPPKLLANELIASALARWIGLPIPDPYFVRVAEGFLPLKYAPRLDDGSGYLAFASVDADTPSLARFYDSNDPVASREITARLREWRGLGNLYGFDEWVANIDRNPGNILFWEDIFLIDHDQAFAGVEADFFELAPANKYENKLRHWLTPTISSEDRRKAAIEAGNLLTGFLDGFEGVVNASRVAEVVSNSQIADALGFITRRVEHVRMLAADALGLTPLEEASL